MFICRYKELSRLLNGTVSRQWLPVNFNARIEPKLRQPPLGFVREFDTRCVKTPLRFNNFKMQAYLCESLKFNDSCRRLNAQQFRKTSGGVAAADGVVESGGEIGGGIVEATSLFDVLLRKIPEEQEKVKQFRAEYGKTKLGDICVSQLYGGMRGMMALIWEPSVLDPDEGIRFRGLTVTETLARLPKASDSAQPLPEGIFWLLLTGEVPTKAQVVALAAEWAERAVLPPHIEQLLSILPVTMHPMTQLSIAVTALSAQSKFREAYAAANVPKQTFWRYAFEDSMDLLAKLPLLAARIYCRAYGRVQALHKCDRDADWTLNFCRLLGYGDKLDFVELMRLYLTIHCDHEGGNVSAHATHLVGSALSDPYLAFAAGLNGLAGPLHGLANQEVLIWLLDLQRALGNMPTDKQLEDYVNATLKAGKLVPGYGHAVLRRTDPRFLAQHEFALKHLPDDVLFQLVAKLYKVVPPLLKKLQKISNPYPNVDAHSGVLLYHYGMHEMNFYTVLFGVSRAMGVLAQLIWSRALGLPIERPKSISTDYLCTMLKELDKHKKVLRI